MKLSELLKHFVVSPRGAASLGFAVLAGVILTIAGLPLTGAILAAIALFVIITAVSFLKGGAAKAVVDERDRQTAEKNKARLDEAVLSCKKLKNIRLPDEELKKTLALLCYESDTYLAKALKDPDCHYDPRALAELDTAFAAIDSYLHSQNQSAVADMYNTPPQQTVSTESDTVRATLLESLNNGVKAFREAEV